eukprot:8180812-Pyramimonas_sp.AAC.1
MRRVLFSKIRLLFSRFLRIFSFCWSVRWLTFWVIDLGPQGGVLTNISGLLSSSVLGLVMALRLAEVEVVM